MITQLKPLVERLDPAARHALEGAAGLCVASGHHAVEVEHLLVKLIEQDTGDVPRMLDQFGIDRSRVLAGLHRGLASFKNGGTRTPALSADLPKLFEHAWLLASIDDGARRIRGAHLLLALRKHEDWTRRLSQHAQPLLALPADELGKRVHALPGSANGADVLTPDAAADPKRATPALDQYTIDLTARARAGRLDPVLGRDAEIRQIVDVLIRRRQNNPILTGEAGVGKTAVVEGLALRIAAGDVPPPLRAVALHLLDLGLLQAGASVKGEFENRLRGVIDEVRASPHPIVLFIDEAHMMIGAGGAAGQADAANLLKPALARGELRTIAATTWAEYKRYFERDAALARRFQVVKVEEPTEEQAIEMLRGMVGTMEAHHGVRILDAAVVAAVRLSNRYVSGRQLPDKAVSVLDTACARVALAQHATPGPIEDAMRRIDTMSNEIAIVERESATEPTAAARLGALDETRTNAVERLASLRTAFEHERTLGRRVHELRERLEAPADAAARERDRDAFTAAITALGELQRETALVPTSVDPASIATVIAGWTGIPLGRMRLDDLETVLGLEATLGERVVGQPHALAAIASRIRTARANIEDPGKPVGVFLLVGASGVGKTETALALAEALYGGERNLVTINMSEYQEAHTVSALKGAPPGYVGYGEGGVLTEAVRRKPYSVVLLDEIEKAHPDVLELFFQVFDKGVLDDAEGREVSFRNTVILLTSNVGTEAIMRGTRDGTVQPPPAVLLERVQPALRDAFKPAFLARLTVVPYYPLSDTMLERIVRLKLERIAARVAANHAARFEYAPEVVAAIAARSTEAASGARAIDGILSGTMLPEIAVAVLARMGDAAPIASVRIGLDATGRFTYDVT
jgi:type VI secretion system protein VasG